MTPLAQPKPDPLAPCECCTTGAPVLRLVEELRAEVVRLAAEITEAKRARKTKPGERP